MNSKIEIEKKQLKELYNTLANYPQISKEQIESEMKKCFGEDVFNLSPVERIKTFEDARKELGEQHPFVKSYCGYVANIHEEGMNDDDLIAFLKLRIVVAALNEGWEPQFNKDEYRYYPWLYLYTKEEIKDMGMDERKERNLHISPVGEYAGFAFAASDTAPSYASARIGSRLCLKNSELATYCGKQFITLWKQFGFR